ncbi:hypothetical protein R69608_03231 [Paraburkholderia nemoris]|uniref:hypothetical protein n=1 Tax=Paraburkholderia nemoris TaxID=2793076 RepID=UPI0019131CF7|nr:hypothetical protein [Paraburkholderia nemoris]MBK5148556.1 hypothetical protein [Burkholderia sp. R-69608]CAE6906300.1 hypothetical protein R69608_03231 [Paraburkholderia nemoris]
MLKFCGLTMATAVTYYHEVKKLVTEEVNAACSSLLDCCCENHSVIALAYLRYGWPMSVVSPQGLRRLSSSLAELLAHHHESLNTGEAERRLL